MAGIGGAVMGGAMGVFMFSSSQDTSFTPSSTQDSYKWHSREGLKQLGKELRHTTLHWSKTFAVCGLAISSCECLIEQQLGIKNVFTNMAAGCVAGAGLGYQGGIHGMALGCAGFAAFGVAIDYFMDH